MTSLLLTTLHTEPAALPVTYLCVLLWMIGVALLGPLLGRAGVAALGIVWRASRVSGFLAANNLQMYSRRMATVVTPLALLIGVTRRSCSSRPPSTPRCRRRSGTV